jgi:hypothetical protein
LEEEMMQIFTRGEGWCEFLEGVEGGVNFQRRWVEVGEREEESVKRVADRSLDSKHASMGESLQRLYPEG